MTVLSISVISFFIKAKICISSIDNKPPYRYLIRHNPLWSSFFTNYELIIGNVQKHFGDIELSAVKSVDILAFMSTLTDGNKQNAKKLRFTRLSAFFNFAKNSLEPEIQNPCNNPALRKLFRAAGLVKLIDEVDEGAISGKIAKTVFEEMAASGDSPAAIVKKRGLAQISDAGAIENAVDEVLANNPQQVETYRGGKTKVMGFLVGQVMKATRGKANPKLVNQALREKLR